MLNTTATLEGWKEYEKTLDEYLRVNKRDSGDLIARKIDAIRIQLLMHLKKETPKKREITREARGRGYTQT